MVKRSLARIGVLVLAMLGFSSCGAYRHAHHKSAEVTPADSLAAADSLKAAADSLAAPADSLAAPKDSLVVFPDSVRTVIERPIICMYGVPSMMYKAEKIEEEEK